MVVVSETLSRLEREALALSAQVASASAAEQDIDQSDTDALEDACIATIELERKLEEKLMVIRMCRTVAAESIETYRRDMIAVCRVVAEIG